VKRGSLDLVLRLARAASVRGAVVNDAGIPVAGAQLKAGEASAVADTTGRFHLPAVAAKKGMAIEASANGYEDAALVLDLEPGEDLDLDEPLVLTAMAGLSGRVFDPAGEPLAGVAVAATKDSFDMSSGETDAGGRYFIAEPAEGTLTLTFKHPEYLAEQLKEIRYRKGDRTVAPDVRLRPGGVIVARILDPKGQPVEGATARIIPAGGELNFGTIMLLGMGDSDLPESDQEGKLRLPGLDTGTYLLRVDAAGYRPFVRKDIAVRVPETTSIEIVLDAGLSITGRVLSDDDRPLEGVTIRATFEEDQEGAGSMQEKILFANEGVTATSDEDGRFVVRGLPDVTVDLAVEKEGYARRFVSDVEPGTSDLTVKLERTGAVSGMVLDDVSGEPVGGASINVDDGTSTHQVTDEDGTFIVPNVTAGKFTVTVTSMEHVPAEVTDIEVRSGATTSGLEVRLKHGEVLVGRVIRRSDGLPVSKATVSVNEPVSRSAESDQEGRFELRGLPSGVYAVSVTSGNYSRRTMEGVPVPSATELLIELSAGGTIRGIVRDGEGEPVSGQMVMAGSGGDMFENMTNTDSEGNFTFSHVAPGKHIVMVLKIGEGGGVGFGAQTRQVTVEEGQEAFVEFGEQGSTKKAHLTGRLLDHGQPAGGRMLIFLRADVEGGMAEMMSSFKIITTDAEGGYSADDLQPGTYRVFSGGMGQDLGTSMELTVTETGEAKHDLVLTDGMLTGSVVRADNGAPLAGAKIMLLDPAASIRPATSMADILGLMKGQFASGRDGTFELDDAVIGPLMVQVFLDGFAPVVIPDLVISNKPGAPLRIRLEEGYGLNVKVRDARGQPLRGADVLVFDEAGHRMMILEDSMSGTDTTGALEMRLSPGTWRILAQADGFAPAERMVSMQRDADVELTVTPGGTLVTMVTGPAGPVEGALVQTFDDSGREIAEHVTQEGTMTGSPSRRTGADGRNVRANTPPGSYRLVVTTRDGRKAETRVRVVEGGVVEAALAVD
jgi:protocatechuate 3,4-dioxygenase beta subunit